VNSPLVPDTPVAESICSEKREGVPSLLFAVKDREKEFFFEDGFCEERWEGFEARWLKDSEMEASRWSDLLWRIQPEVLISGWGTPPPPRDWIESPDCRLAYLCHLTGSVRKMVPRSFLERGGRVTNWGALAAPMVAEHALLLALAALRNLPAWRPLILKRPERNQRKELLEARSLIGRQVGIHGFGKVVRELLPLLRPFGVALYGYSEGVPLDLMKEEGVVPVSSLKELFARSEILIECEALTPRSRGSVSAKELAALPDGAVFVNVGRGMVVDEAALIEEARSGRLRIALDVVASEPLTKDHPLSQVPDVILSPHMAGPTPDHYRDCGRLALENIGRYLRGEALKAEVTLSAYDRAT